MNTTDLSSFNNKDYQPGVNLIVRAIWYFCNILFLKNSWNPFSGLRKLILRIFGAKIGKGVVIKPAVNIKYPWKLTVGNYTWIGEGVWIDSLDEVVIGDNVCISQGALLLCGNHDYNKSSFDLITGKIFLEDGVWIGAKAVVCPGVTCRSHSILAVGSVATKDMEEYGIYQGNPAIKKSVRK